MANENTPYIGENGNWYINGEDTGMRSQGEEGPQGPVGPQGLIGPKGNTGDRGPQGVKGDTPELVANLQEMVEGKALDATMGKALDNKIATNKSSIDTLNSNLFYQSVDFSRFKDNLLLVDDSSFYTNENKTVRFSYPKTNSPINDSAFRGIWKLNWFSTTQFMVELIELSPVPGRKWSNYYFAPNWGGWKSITPQ